MFSNGIGDYNYFCTSHNNNYFDVSTDGQEISKYEVKLTNLTETQTYKQFEPTNGRGYMDLPQLSEGYYLFWARAHNGCGRGDWYETELEFMDCSLMEGGGMYSLVFSPNPSTNQTTMSIEPKSKEVAFDGEIEWGLEIYRQAAFKEKKPKLKGKKTIINTSGWKEGIYLVRVQYKGEVLHGKLVVN